MKKIKNIMLFLPLLAIACTTVKKNEPVLKQPTIEMVKITAGPWHHAMELERQYLRSLDMDRLLFHFRKTAGIETDAKEYGGWEMEWRELRGHSIGHYLSAASRMANLTNDSLLLENCKYVVAELNRCQQKIGTGYVSAWPTEYLDRVENLKKVWAPYYTLHKILAGLFDAYVYTNDQVALKTAIDFTHYLHSRIMPLGEEYFQKVLDVTEQGGINEVFWDMFAETGDTTCRNLANIFYQHSYLDPLLDGKETLKGWHSNSFIPHVVGIAREYELTGDITRKQMSERFWKHVVDGRSFITGGTSNGEHWNADPYHMDSELGPGAHESCCSYNMLKLSEHLWDWTKDVKYQDYIEKTLTNAILPSQNSSTGMSMYYISMAPGYYKTWGTPDSAFWCCTGTGMENFSRIAEYLYGVSDNRLYINQFVPSELNYEEEGFKLIQETSLPDGDALKIKIESKNPVTIKLAIRIPSWSGNDYSISLNGKSLESKPAPGSYLFLDRTWKSGDELNIDFEAKLWYSLLPINNKYVSFGIGSTVLSARFEDGDSIPENLRHRYGPYDGKPVDVPSILFSSLDFEKYVEVADKEKRVFKVHGQLGEEVTLVPFYNIENEYFSIYLPIDTLQNELNIKEVDPSDHI